MAEPRLLQIGKYFPPDSGGIETVSLGIAEALSTEGIETGTLAFARSDFYDDHSMPYAVYRARTDLRLWGKSISIDYLLRLRKLQASYDVALLHAPNPIGMAAAALFWRKPLILLWHSDIVGFGAMGRAVRPLERHVAERSDAVLAPASAHVSGSYLCQELAPKAQIIPFPFDRAWLEVGATTGVADDVFRFARGRHLILAVGRLVAYKGFDVLIDAAAALDPSLAICIAGTGPLDGVLREAVARAGLQDRILLVGHVQNADLVRLYRAARVVTMPSVTRQEMYGMTQVEAMAFGVPVVSTAIPNSAVAEVNLNGVTGLVVPPRDPDALAVALNCLANDDVRHRELAVGAHHRFRAEHALEVFGRRLAALVRRVSDAEDWPGSITMPHRR